MDYQTAGQYEYSNFLDVWSNPNLIPNDSENLNINLMEEFGESNQSIFNVQNDNIWKNDHNNSSSAQNSSPLFLDEVVRILNFFTENQSKNCHSQNVFEESQSENQMLPSIYDNQDFYSSLPQCKAIVSNPEEHLPLFNSNFVENFSTIPNFDSKESLSNCSPKHSVNESSGKSCILNKNSSHFEEKLVAEVTEIKADSAEVKNKKKARTVFTDMQIKTMNSAFLKNNYLTPEILDILVRSLKLPENKIKIWFCNKRATLKKRNKKLCGSNCNRKKSSSSRVNHRCENSVERAKNCAYDQKSKLMKNKVDYPKSYVYEQNWNQVESLGEYKKNCLHDKYSYQIENLVEGPKEYADVQMSNSICEGPQLGCASFLSAYHNQNLENCYLTNSIGFEDIASSPQTICFDHILV